MGKRITNALASALLALAACTDLGGLAGDETTSTKDGGKGKEGGTIPTEGGSVVDDSGIPSGPARCDPTKPFGSPELMNAFDATSDFVKDAVLSSDELEAFYLLYLGSGNWQLRHSRRASLDDTWGTPTPESVTPSPQGTLSLTANDRKLYFWTIDNDYRTSRATTSAAFGMPTTYFAPSTPMAFFVAADDTAYFAAFDADGGTDNKVIRRAGTSSTGLSSTSVAVENIHAPNVLDSHPVLNASETALYFSSNRSGSIGLDDIWVARRASKQAQFNPPTHIAELSTPDPDVVTWIAADDCQVLLDRASHVYFSRRPL